MLVQIIVLGALAYSAYKLTSGKKVIIVEGDDHRNEVETSSILMNKDPTYNLIQRPHEMPDANLEQIRETIAHNDADIAPTMYQLRDSRTSWAVQTGKLSTQKPILVTLLTDSIPSHDGKSIIYDPIKHLK
jgi:hypothetical protein